MNSNRGQYNDSPMYNMKNRRSGRRREPIQVPDAPQAPEARPQTAAPEQGMKRHGLLSAMLSLVLPALFLVCLLVPANEARWAFLGLTAFCLLSMWVLGAFVRSARNTLTVIYLALAAVIALALFMNQQTPEARNAAAGRNVTAAAPEENQAPLAVQVTAAPAPTADPASLVSEAEKRLDGFFQAWMKNQIQEILKYCSPAWINNTAAPTNVIFQNLSGNLPLSYQVESAAGSDANTSRVITVRAVFQDGAETVDMRINVRMVKTNDIWYVDPNSLDLIPVNEEEEQKAAARILPNINTTKAPVATPDPNQPDIKVYYNKAGKGKYYHADKICPRVDSQWWPLEEFSFSLINSQEFKNLLPCEKCGAPARPSVNR